MGVINADVLLRLDERTAKAVSEQIANSGRDAASGFERQFAANFTGLRGTMQRAGRDASEALTSEMRSGVHNALGGMMSEFGSLGRVANSALGGISTGAAAAGAGIAAVAVGAGLATKAFYDLGKTWDNISDSITIKTGKVGDDLKSLTNIVGDVGSTTAASLGSIGNIVGQISQSLPDLAQNNAAVRQMASNLAYLDANGQSVNIRELGMAFRAFGVDASAQVQSLDNLNSTAQATGVPINELIAMVRSGAPQFRQFGLDIGQSTGVLASFAQAGVAPEAAVAGLRIALKNVGGDSRGASVALADAVTQIKALHDAGKDPAAQQLAQNVFGGKTFAPFLQAIETGTLDVQSLNRAMQDSGPSIAKLQGETDDWSESLEKSKNTISTALKPVADTVFGGISTLLSNALESTRMWGEALGITSSQLQNIASVPITPDSALGKMLTPGGLAGGSTPGVATPGGLGNAIAGVPGAGLTLPGGLLGPSWGSHNIAAPHASGSSGSSSAQVPYGPMPAISSGVPMTADVYSAQSSLWEAQHAVAQKEAELNRLRASNTAKAEELIGAQNAVDKANRDRTESEMRFATAQQNAYENQFKQLNKAADSLEDVGAKIDNDFGVSKGLPGIAENLTKFLMNLAFAPVYGALGGVQAASGFKKGEAGSGLMGMLSSSGAFGPGMVPVPGGTSSYGPAGMYGPSSGGGAPYGLAPGTNTGGYGSSGGAFPPWVHELEQAFGVKASTYPGHQESDRHEAGYAANPGHENRGIDWSGPVDAMQRFANYLSQVPGSLEQVIWKNPNTGQATEIAGGRPQPGYFSGDLGEHENHVHTRQSSSIPLPGGSMAMPSLSGGGGGLSPSQWNNIAGAESSGNWAINSGNGYSGGLQFAPSTWNSFGGNQYAPQAWQATPDQQMAVGNNVLAAQGPGAWPATSTAHPDWFQPGAPGGGTGTGAGFPGLGGPPQFGPFGAPGSGLAGGPGWLGGPAAPGVGSAMGLGLSGPAAPSQSVAGGRQFGQGLPASGGISFNGGLIGAAMSAAAGAAGAAGSFGAGGGAASAAADMGMQLIGRAVGAAGQYAGNAVGGLMETFALNDSPLADPGHSWLGRLAIAGAGMRPALPNAAGMLGGAGNPNMLEGGKEPPGPMSPEMAKLGGAAKGQGQGDTTHNETNINVTNNRATEDGTGRDIQAHLGAQAMASAPR